MGERTSHAPGTFSWAELATSDAEAAKSFYTSVLGWDYEDNPMGDGMVYSMAFRDGRRVAALFRTEEPPHWNCYVTVSSVDDVTPRAADLGGRIIREPFDVLEFGRMSEIADPTGAALALWEARSRIGAELVNTPGAMTWNDLVTPDPEASARFYGSLFGWTTLEIPDSGGYRVIRNGLRSNGGMLARDGVPPSWMPYFGHPDLDALVGRIGGLGGRVLSEPLAVPSGRFAVFADPQGAMFAALTGDYDD